MVWVLTRAVCLRFIVPADFLHIKSIFGELRCEPGNPYSLLPPPGGKSEPTVQVMVSSLLVPPPPPMFDGATTGTATRQRQQKL